MEDGKCHAFMSRVKTKAEASMILIKAISEGVQRISCKGIYCVNSQLRHNSLVRRLHTDGIYIDGKNRNA